MFSVRPNAIKKIFSTILQNHEFVLCCWIWKKQTTLDTFFLHSCSVSLSSQFFCVTMRIRSMLFSLNGNWNAPVTSRAVWCESWPWCLLETEDVITWIGVPVLRDWRCVMDTSRNCSVVFPHSRNLYWVVFSVALWQLWTALLVSSPPVRERGNPGNTCYGVM